MGYISPFIIMLITLLSMQFATSKESPLFCFTGKHQKCYETFVQRMFQQECAADEAIQCLKQIAEECDVDSAAMEQVQEMEQVLNDVCQTGSKMNAGFLKHMNCLFGTELKLLNLRCYDNIFKALSKFKTTGNTEKNQKGMHKIACRYTDEVKNCLSANFRDSCGEDAQNVQRKFSDPANNLEEMACNYSSDKFEQF